MQRRVRTPGTGQREGAWVSRAESSGAPGLVAIGVVAGVAVRAGQETHEGAAPRMADDQRLAARADTGACLRRRRGTKRQQQDGEKAVGTEGLHERTPFLPARESHWQASTD